MKRFIPKSYQGRKTLRARGGFTLPDLLVSLGIFMIVVGGVLATHLFGLRLYELTRAKLGSSDEARRTLSLVIDEIRTAAVVEVGQGGLESFEAFEPSEPQAGNALQIYPLLSSPDFIRYYRDPSDNTLKRTLNGVEVDAVVATSVTNAVVFTSENHLGNILTNNQNNHVVGLILQFAGDPLPGRGTGAQPIFDHYQIRTRVTRRVLQ